MYKYTVLNVTLSNGVATVVIDNQHCEWGMNILTATLAAELADFSKKAETDDDIRVIVLRSGDPDFFIAHYDVAALVQVSAKNMGKPVKKMAKLGSFVRICERFRTMSKVSIVEIAGRAGGGGNELAASCDMRFGLYGKTKINQMEVPLGILPGGTGTQRLPLLIGRSRAMELILGGVDMDAETAEKWGYLNRCFSTKNELEAHVDSLAARIAQFPPSAVSRAKQAILNSMSMPTEGALLEEAYLFDQAMAQPEATVLMTAFLEAGGQTREGEKMLPTLAPYLPIEKALAHRAKSML
jgi:enoyl-CoA hydratase/carnithine racemase